MDPWVPTGSVRVVLTWERTLLQHLVQFVDGAGRGVEGGFVEHAAGVAARRHHVDVAQLPHRTLVPRRLRLHPQSAKTREMDATAQGRVKQFSVSSFVLNTA